MAEKIESRSAKKTLIGRISSRLSKVLDWLAKGQAGNPPCRG